MRRPGGYTADLLALERERARRTVDRSKERSTHDSARIAGSRSPGAADDRRDHGADHHRRQAQGGIRGAAVQRRCRYSEATDTRPWTAAKKNSPSSRRAAKPRFLGSEGGSGAHRPAAGEWRTQRGTRRPRPGRRSARRSSRWTPRSARRRARASWCLECADQAGGAEGRRRHCALDQRWVAHSDRPSAWCDVSAPAVWLRDPTRARRRPTGRSTPLGPPGPIARQLWVLRVDPPARDGSPRACEFRDPERPHTFAPTDAFTLLCGRMKLLRGASNASVAAVSPGGAA